MKSSEAVEKLDEIKRSLEHSIGADGDLTAFYELARKDSILKHVIEDFCGMHSTGPDTIFPRRQPWQFCCRWRPSKGATK
jgi:hypothetical protein